MRNPVVIIPGYYGSKLSDRLSGELLWLDGHQILHSGEMLDAIRLDTGDPDRVIATGILDEVLVFPFWTPDVYKPLLDFLAKELLYKPDEIYPFFVDWRKSITLAADDLERRIRGLLTKTGATKVDIIAHSHGGLVARSFLHRHNPALVSHFITLGVPHKGMHKTFVALDRGISFLGFSQSHVRDVSRSFPSAYELLPVDPSDDLFHLSGAKADPFVDNGWTANGASKRLLADAEKVMKGLPLAVPVKSTFIYGTHLETTTLASATAGGALTFTTSDDGDSTVPRVSGAGRGLTGDIARFPIPFGVHSQLFNHPSARRLMKDVLLDRNVIPHFVTGFESGRLFRPNSTNRISVEVRDPMGAPLNGASVQLKLRSNNKKVQLEQTNEGDFFASIKMPGKGQHLEYEVIANAQSLAQPIVERGMLFAGNF